ncbi:hypothetical protein LWI28_026704 [Acer negundo]|uniref:Uncharacterized protein n=1 Tax=Acer negundo TaxID=4023 RepID=A0AAD5IPZ2_ACENE|nr:hypothetical protein LWI28_026704 [Acer negundo]
MDVSGLLDSLSSIHRVDSGQRFARGDTPKGVLAQVIGATSRGDVSWRTYGGTGVGYEQAVGANRSEGMEDNNVMNMVATEGVVRSGLRDLGQRDTPIMKDSINVVELVVVSQLEGAKISDIVRDERLPDGSLHEIILRFNKIPEVDKGLHEPLIGPKVNEPYSSHLAQSVDRLSI